MYKKIVKLSNLLDAKIVVTNFISIFFFSFFKYNTHNYNHDKFMG